MDFNKPCVLNRWGATLTGLPHPRASSWLASVSRTIFYYHAPYRKCFRHFCPNSPPNHEILILQICCISAYVLCFITLFLCIVLFFWITFALPRTNVSPTLRRRGLEQGKVFLGDWRVGEKCLGHLCSWTLPDRIVCFCTQGHSTCRRPSASPAVAWLQLTTCSQAYGWWRLSSTAGSGELPCLLLPLILPTSFKISLC